MKLQSKDIRTDNLWKIFQEKQDSKSFRALFDCTYEPLCRYAFFIVNDKWDAEEIVLDFFIHMWQSRSELHIAQSADSYFFRSVRNRCLNFLRTSHPAKSLEEIMYSEVPPDLTSIDYGDLTDIIKETVISLSPKCQEVFTKSRTLNQSNEEIAEDMGVTVKAVEAHMTKALKAIRIALKKFYILAL